MWKWVVLILFLILIAIIVWSMLRRGGGADTTGSVDEQRHATGAEAPRAPEQTREPGGATSTDDAATAVGGVGPAGPATPTGQQDEPYDQAADQAADEEPPPPPGEAAAAGAPTLPEPAEGHGAGTAEPTAPVDEGTAEPTAPVDEGTDEPTTTAPESHETAVEKGEHGHRYADGSTDVTGDAVTEFAEPAGQEVQEPGRGTDTDQPPATSRLDEGDLTSPLTGKAHGEHGHGEWGAPDPSAPPAEPGTTTEAGSEGMGTSSSGGMGTYRESATGTQNQADLGEAGSGHVDLPGATPLTPAPYGPGSAEPDEDGAGPEGWTVKGNAGSMLFHTEDSPSYGNRADVWFESEDAAKSAGFKHWDRKRR